MNHISDVIATLENQVAALSLLDGVAVGGSKPSYPFRASAWDGMVYGIGAVTEDGVKVVLEGSEEDTEVAVFNTATLINKLNILKRQIGSDVPVFVSIGDKLYKPVRILKAETEGLIAKCDEAQPDEIPETVPDPTPSLTAIRPSINAMIKRYDAISGVNVNASCLADTPFAFIRNAVAGHRVLPSTLKYTRDGMTLYIWANGIVIDETKSTVGLSSIIGAFMGVRSGGYTEEQKRFIHNFIADYQEVEEKLGEWFKGCIADAIIKELAVKYGYAEGDKDEKATLVQSVLDYLHD